MENKKIVPVLALRGITAFPKMLLHFDVGRAISIKALEKGMKDNQTIFLVAQKKISSEKPTFKDLYTVGTLAKIKQILKLQSGDVRVLVEGIERGVIIGNVREKPFLMAEIESLPDYDLGYRETVEQKTAFCRTLFEAFDDYLELQTKVSPDILTAIIDKVEPSEISDFIAQNIPIDNSKKQVLLEERDAFKRCIELTKILENEIEILEIEYDISRKVKEKVDKNQREYYLREQLRVVLNELGEDDSIVAEYDEYIKKIEALRISDKSKEKLLSEAKKMRRLGNSSQEGSVIRNYIDFVLSLPFNITTKDKTDIKRAIKTLDENHYGMKKVKERILETLALRAVSGTQKGTVICLVGPPGVGKTSIASSIAKSMGRNMARVSLGGVRDESEIRGHRKTYVGAMSGKIIRAMSDAKSLNPVILLDEVDKMSSDMRGDPAAAMLEVLDFEQNDTFFDHYLDIPFDLSKTVFIATANNLGTIPRPLLDRMEVIELSSYTNVEKFHIAKEHIIPKVMKKYSLKRIKISDFAVNSIITSYTREAGVRRLEQQVEKIARKIAFKMLDEDKKSFTINANLEEFLGKPIYIDDHFSKKSAVGIVNGLAYTSVGGTILPVEVNILPGDGKTQLTGNLGNVMKESAMIAISYIRSIADELEIEQDFYKKYDIHIHFPEGAVPKDGPSAGITMATAIISALTGKKARADVAMTGEISLRGNVLPIGGLREKTMAAYMNGIKKVIISKENEKDLADLEPEVLENVEFVIAQDIQTVLEHTLISYKKKDEDISLLVSEMIEEPLVIQ